MLGHIAIPGVQIKFASSSPHAAALERDPVAVVGESAPKPSSPKKQVTDRSWAVLFACQISAVFRVLRALRKQKSEPEAANNAGLLL